MILGTYFIDNILKFSVHLKKEMSLVGKISLVTGASKGIGKGIACQLGQAGSTVYITGRSVDKLSECADIIQKRGGTAIPVPTDHSNDASVQKLFDQIKSDQGKLDILVNNAYAGVDFISRNTGKKFYLANPSEQWDCINGVGLRNHFLCTVFASRIMVPQKDGLIVNVSSVGGLSYLFNVPYGIGKAACDRMAADCARELKRDNVTMISLWPGAVKTEYIEENVFQEGGFMNRPKSVELFKDAESVEYSGKAIVNLAKDTKRISKTGKILWVSDLAREYGFRDEDGQLHDSRSLKNILNAYGYNRLSNLIPSSVRVPHFMIHQAGNKF